MTRKRKTESKRLLSKKLRYISATKRQQRLRYPPQFIIRITKDTSTCTPKHSNRDVLWRILALRGIPSKVCNLISGMYCGSGSAAGCGTIRAVVCHHIGLILGYYWGRSEVRSLNCVHHMHG